MNSVLSAMGSFMRLSAKHIASLPKLMEDRLPDSCMLYNVVKLYLDKRFSENIKTEFFAYNGEVEDIDKSFIVANQHRTFFSDISIITSEAETKSITNEMTKAFDTLVNWNKPLTFHTSCIPHVYDLIKQHPGVVTFYQLSFAFYMPIEEALELELRLPDEVEAHELSPAEAARISKTWKFSTGGTPGNMSDSIQTVGSFGLYIGQECIGWIVNSTNGNFYALNVKQEYRGKGIGEMTLSGMAKAAAQKGLIPNAHVKLNNRVQFNLFEKVGFLCSNAVEHIKYRPQRQQPKHTTYTNEI